MLMERRSGAAVSVFLCVSALFFLVAGFPQNSLRAQDLPAPNSSIAEEQDYAFAYGLYRDGLYQAAAEQLSSFGKKYPRSIKFQDVQFLHADCFLQMQQYAEAAREFSSFVTRYPSAPLSDNARFKLADAYTKLGRNLDAVQTYKSILERPNNPATAGEAAYWIGEIYLKESDFNNALKYYTLSYEGYPGNRLSDYAAYSAGWVNQKKGDNAGASAWYRIVIEKYPQSQLVSSARLKIGECYYLMKEYGKAAEELTAAKSRIDSVSLRGEADYLIGESYYNLGDFDKAGKQYEYFLKEYPTHKLANEVQYALAWSLFKERRFDEAAAAFGKLSSTSDQFGTAPLYRKGVAQKLAGKRAEAVETFRLVVEQDPKAEYADNALYDAGVLLFEEKRTEDAKVYFSRVIAEYPGSDVAADASMMLGECYVASGAFDPARVLFERALSGEGASFETKVNATYQLAWSNYKLSKFKEASKGFANVISSFPGHPKSVEALYWLAESEYQGGEYRNAIKHYQEIAKNASHARREESMYGIGWSYYKLTDYAKAIDSFERLIIAYPNGKLSFDGRLRLGDCYFQQKDYKKAAGSYRTVVRLFPKNEGADYALYQLGQTYFRSGDHEQATDQFSALLSSYPSSSLADDAQYAIGWIKFQRKDYLGAIKDFQVLIAAYPASELIPRATYGIADAYYNLRQYSASEKAYREVIQKFPRSPLAADALTGVQYSLVAQGKSKEAVGTIDSFVKENPESPNAEQLELKKVELLFSQKEYLEAARACQTFVDQRPQSPLRSQAFFWLGRSLKEADSLSSAAMAFQAAADVPQAQVNVRGNALLETARIYVRLKDYERAYGVLSRAERDLVDTDFASEVLYTKGVVLFDNGALDDAKSAFEVVISKYPAAAEADKARVGLTKIAIASLQYTAAQDLAQRVATSRTDETGAEAQFLSGLAFEKATEWQNAITAYLRLKYVFPSHEQWLAKACLGLGRSYEKVKETAKAREAYQQVLTLVKSGEDFDEATRRIAALGQD